VATRIVMLAALTVAAMLIDAHPTHATARPPGVAEPVTPPAEGSVLHAPSNPIALTDAQRARIGEILDESRAYAELLKAELEDARGDLKHELDQREPDFDDVMREVERVGELETRLRKHQIATLMSLRALLSQDQLAGLTRLFKMISHGRADDTLGLPAESSTHAETRAESKTEVTSGTSAEPAPAAGP